MSIARKLVIGATLAAMGLAGLAYTMPLISNEVASEKPVYKEDDVPEYPRSLQPYTAMEVFSAAVMTGGIVLCAVGLSETLTVPFPSQTDIRDKANIDDDKESS